MTMQRIVRGGFLAALVALASACVIAPAPREGYYDHPHNRYWANHAWHGCNFQDEHCR